MQYCGLAAETLEIKLRAFARDLPPLSPLTSSPSPSLLPLVFHRRFAKAALSGLSRDACAPSFSLACRARRLTPTLRTFNYNVLEDRTGDARLTNYDAPRYN